MAEHTIEINPLNPVSVLNAQLKFNFLVRNFDRKVDEFLHEVAEVGLVAAEGNYGDEEVDVRIDPIPGGYCLSANGEQVVFIEFGAGKGVNESNELVSRMPFEVYDGSYSDMMHGDYQASGYVKWRYDGVTYYEIMHRDGMQQALIEMLDKWREIAERVFG